MKLKLNLKSLYIILGRFLFTLALLAVIWMHAHWSVALALTLIFIAREVDNFVFGTLVRTFKRLFESEAEVRHRAEIDRVLEEMLEKARARNVYQQTKTDQSN